MGNFSHFFPRFVKRTRWDVCRGMSWARFGRGEHFHRCVGLQAEVPRGEAEEHRVRGPGRSWGSWGSWAPGRAEPGTGATWLWITWKTLNREHVFGMIIQNFHLFWCEKEGGGGWVSTHPQLSSWWRPKAGHSTLSPAVGHLFTSYDLLGKRWMCTLVQLNLQLQR